MSIRILLADDHAVVRAGLRHLLDSEPDMDIVADTGDGRTAVRLVRDLKPDVAILDIGMPDMNGIEATREIRRETTPTRVICLSMHRERELVDAALLAGVAGYVLKDDTAKSLAEAVRTVAGGGMFVSPAVSGDILRNYARGNAAKPGGAFATLTSREREVLQLIAEGRSSKEVAAKLHLSEKTVGAHREHIMAKLGLRNAVELTRYALREGITHL